MASEARSDPNLPAPGWQERSGAFLVRENLGFRAFRPMGAHARPAPRLVLINCGRGRRLGRSLAKRAALAYWTARARLARLWQVPPGDCERAALLILGVVLGIIAAWASS